MTDIDEDRKAVFQRSEALRNAYVSKAVLRRLQADALEFFETAKADIQIGRHQWGQLRDDMDWYALDTKAAFLAAYTVPLPRFGLILVEKPEFDRRTAGFWNIWMPKWTDSRIPHPAGRAAIPDEHTWVATPTLDLLNRVCGPVQPLRAYVAAPNPAPNALNYHPSYAFFSELGKKYKSSYDFTKDPEKRQFIKRCYGGLGLSVVGTGAGAWNRPDVVRLVHAEAFARLWSKAYDGVEAGQELVFIGDTDTIGYRGTELPTETPQSWGIGTGHFGKLKIKSIHRAERNARI